MTFSSHKFKHNFQNILWHSVDSALMEKLGGNFAGFLNESCPLLKSSIRSAKTMSSETDIPDLCHI